MDLIPSKETHVHNKGKSVISINEPKLDAILPQITDQNVARVSVNQIKLNSVARSADT